MVAREREFFGIMDTREIRRIHVENFKDHLEAGGLRGKTMELIDSVPSMPEIQEAVTRLFELSGKTKEMANGKYSENYATFWIAHNAMLAFLKTWERQNKWCTSFEDEAHPFMNGKRYYSPDWGWLYC